MIGVLNISSEIVFRWIPHDTADKSTLFQVIACANVDTDLCYHMVLLTHNGLKMADSSY